MVYVKIVAKESEANESLDQGFEIERLVPLVPIF